MDDGTVKPTFRGFRKPNYTQVPDEIFDELLPLLSGAELKVLMYICRRTFGFKKESDTISLNQIATGIRTRDGRILDSGTGLSKRHVQRALKGLEDKNAVRVIRSLDKDGVNETNNYTLHFVDGVGTKSPYGRDMDVVGVGTPVSTTTYSNQETVNNVNVAFKTPRKKESELTDPAEAELLDRIIRTLGDKNPKSTGTFRRIIRTLGVSITTRLLANTQEAYHLGSVKADKLPAYFVGMAKNVAKENNLDLGFKAGAKRAEALDALTSLKDQIGNRGVMNSHRSYA